MPETMVLQEITERCLKEDSAWGSHGAVVSNGGIGKGDDYERPVGSFDIDGDQEIAQLEYVMVGCLSVPSADVGVIVPFA